LRLINNTGHKLISGFPEGRRLWLNVKFYDPDDNLVREVNPYTPLEVTTDAEGNAQYVSGGILTHTRDDLVYEASMSSLLTGENHTFHFVLGTDRSKDNRIPPKGFDIANAGARLATPRWEDADAPDYFTEAEYAGGYDEVTVSKPAAAVRWEASLYYQTTSKEYVEFLRDEINGTGGTLAGPGAANDPAYIIQTDPYFATLKDWGRAIWDLWLHNEGCAPILVNQLQGGVAPPPPPCLAPTPPENFAAEGGKRRVTLNWDPVNGIDGYNVYYSQGGKYTLIATVTSPGYTENRLQVNSTYCYAVTAFVNCDDGSIRESDYSGTACAIPTR
jgi:hypothetical protein